MLPTHNFENWFNTYKHSNPNYYKFFYKHWKNGENTSDIKNLMSYLVNQSIRQRFHYGRLDFFTLPKNIFNYKDFQELKRDTEIIQNLNRFKFCLSESDIPSKYLKQLNDIDWRNMTDFVSLHEIQRSRRFKTYNTVNDFFNRCNIELRLDNETLFKDYARLVEQTHGCKLIHAKNNVVVVRVKTFKAMKKVGIDSWCITNTKKYWNKYVRFNCNQFIIADFNFLPTGPKSYISFTRRKIISILPKRIKSAKYNSHIYPYMFDAYNNGATFYQLEKYINFT